MQRNKFKPFIRDFFVMMFIVTLVSFCMVYNRWIEIRIIRMNIIVICLSVMSLFYVLCICNNTIFLGIRALVDFCFQNYTQVSCVYIKQIVARSALFSEKYSNNNLSTRINKVRATYYDVVVEYEGRKISFVSSEAIILNEGEPCLFKIGKTSKVIIEYEKLENSKK